MMDRSPYNGASYITNSIILRNTFILSLLNKILKIRYKNKTFILIKNNY